MIEQPKRVLEEKTVLSFYFRGGRIPRYMVKAILRYFNEKLPPGNFLRAVLENDLMNATGRADSENCGVLHVYTALLYNHCPKDSFGSKEAVRAWLASREDEED